MSSGENNITLRRVLIPKHFWRNPLAYTAHARSFGEWDPPGPPGFPGAMDARGPDQLRARSDKVWTSNTDATTYDRFGRVIQPFGAPVFGNITDNYLPTPPPGATSADDADDADDAASVFSADVSLTTDAIFTPSKSVIGAFTPSFILEPLGQEEEVSIVHNTTTSMFPARTIIIKVMPNPGHNEHAPDLSMADAARGSALEPIFQLNPADGTWTVGTRWGGRARQLRDSLLGTDEEIPESATMPRSPASTYLKVPSPGPPLGATEILPVRDVNPRFFDCPFEYVYPIFWPVPALVDATLVHDAGYYRSVATAQMEYNFFNREYEGEISSNTSITEPVLPCMYSFISEKESEYIDDQNSIYNKNISLGGFMNVDGKMVFKDILNKSGERIGERDVGISDYFSAWARAAKIPNLFTSEVEVDVMWRTFENLIFSQADIDFLNAFAENKEAFPMNVDIKFSTDTDTQVSDALEETQLSADLAGYILTTDASMDMSFVNFDTDYKNTTTKPYETWDVSEWLATIGQPRVLAVPGGAPGVLNPAGVVFGRNKSSETGIINDAAMRSKIAPLLKILFLGKMGKIIRKHRRTFEEILEGKLAHTETVMYHIVKQKVAGTDAAGSPSYETVQNIFIPSSSKLDVCNFIDTQVKYRTDYRYTVHAYQMVFGTKYFYMLPNVPLDESLETSALLPDDRWSVYETLGAYTGTTDIAGGSGDTILAPTFRVVMEPSLKIIKVPFFQTNPLRVLDKPPVAPDVNFIPYKGINNRLLLNLNANVGDYTLVPQTIHPEEETTLINPLRLAQGSMLPGGQMIHGGVINYVSDDPPQAFHVFRLSKKPESYSDFSTAREKRIDTILGRENLSAVSFIDNILPNVKYYYTFRTTDVHNQMSFPSPIYEIEMVDEDGAVYLLVNIHSLEKKDTRDVSTSMNNKIYISPSFSHYEIDLEKTIERVGRSVSSATDIEPNLLVVGLQDLLSEDSEEESVWGKKVKFRFTSKTTGRKFDVNMKFVYDFRSEDGR